MNTRYQYKYNLCIFWGNLLRNDSKVISLKQCSPAEWCGSHKYLTSNDSIIYVAVQR